MTQQNRPFTPTATLSPDKASCPWAHLQTPGFPPPPPYLFLRAALPPPSTRCPDPMPGDRSSPSLGPSICTMQPGRYF